MCKSISRGAWVMDVTHVFMAWRRWVTTLPRVKRCRFQMLQPYGTCLLSPPWSLHPWKLTLHWLILFFRAHSKTYLLFLISIILQSFKFSRAVALNVVFFLPVFIRKALRHMPPLSLTPSSTEFPKFFSANILEEVDGFLLRIAE